MLADSVSILSIDDILSDYTSIDSDGMSWDEMLDGKREDFHYPEVVESIRTKGFIGALVIDSDSFYFGDGNHRLAAMIDLGYKFVPVVQFDSQNSMWSMPISIDSGDWSLGDEIEVISDDISRDAAMAH